MLSPRVSLGNIFNVKTKLQSFENQQFFKFSQIHKKELRFFVTRLKFINLN